MKVVFFFFFSSQVYMLHIDKTQHILSHYHIFVASVTTASLCRNPLNPELLCFEFATAIDLVQTGLSANVASDQVSSRRYFLLI